MHYLNSPLEDYDHLPGLLSSKPSPQMLMKSPNDVKQAAVVMGHSVGLGYYFPLCTFQFRTRGVFVL